MILSTEDDFGKITDNNTLTPENSVSTDIGFKQINCQTVSNLKTKTVN